MTAWPPTSISSSELLSAQFVAVRTKWWKYLNKDIGSGNLLILGVLSVESFDAAGGVHEFLLAGKKWMTFRADFQVDFRLRGTGFERLAAGALDHSIDVFGMDIRFHKPPAKQL